MICSRGEGGAPDQEQAAFWFRMAAEHGHAQAAQEMSERYARGEGVPQDNVQSYAFQLLHDALLKGDMSAAGKKAADHTDRPVFSPSPATTTPDPARVP